MATERSSAGDPARTLALLWRSTESEPPPNGKAPRGPRPTLSVDRVIAVGIALADAEGLDAVTMRRVATELAVAPMTLYTYVPGKAELLDLMLDAAYAEMTRTTPAEDGWRAAVAAIAHDNRALYERHPWVATVATSRPPLGPGLMAKYEYELAAFEGLDLDDVTRDAALTFVLGFVETCARAAADVRAAKYESALSDGEWWAANQPLLDQVFDVERYPLAARVGAAAGAAHDAAYSPGHAYEFGLARVLDGLAALVER
ncbi:TetR/AcrR family transcriptional regulator [Cryptosporangium minutisporangium]|uniref:TetR/AcrR family transcriptional regulator n=1 Tax=Cryptosporangium minutisporangium TaxID=113569 RepID=A0ABP6TD29_9ACTN